MLDTTDSRPDYSPVYISRARLLCTKVATVASLPDTPFRRHDDADVDADDDGTAWDDAPPSVARGRTPCWAIERLLRSAGAGVYVGARLVGHLAESSDSRRTRVAVVAGEGAVRAEMYSNWNATWRNDSHCSTTLVVADSSYLDEDTDIVQCDWRSLARNAAAGCAVSSDTWDPICRCTAQNTWCDNTW